MSKEDLEAIVDLEPEDIKDYFDSIEGLSDEQKQQIFNLIIESKHEKVVDEFAAKIEPE